MTDEIATSPTIKVLVADNESVLSQRLSEFLCSRGFDSRAVRTGTQVAKMIVDWKPDFILYDLMLPEMNALQFLHKMAIDRLKKSKIKVFVLSGHNNRTNVQECMRLGAADYISKPVSHEAILNRLILYMRPKREVPEYEVGSTEDHESALYHMHLTDLTLREALKGLPTAESLHNLTGLLGVSLKAVRVSVVECLFEERKGLVRASSDKKGISGLEIDLNRYPEILYVLTHEKLLALDNLANDPTMHFVTRLEKSINFNTMIIAPLRLKGEIWGVLSVRLPESKKGLTEFNIRWAQIVAHVAALVLLRDSEQDAKSDSDQSAA